MKKILLSLCLIVLTFFAVFTCFACNNAGNGGKEQIPQGGTESELDFSETGW